MTVATGQTVDGVVYDLGTANSLLLMPDTNLTSNLNDAIVTSGSNQTITIGGNVTGKLSAIILGDAASDVGSQIWIMGEAVVTGLADAIRVRGTGARIENAGVITGIVGLNVSDGISLEGSGTAKTTINNSGLIYGESAIYFSSGLITPVDIRNSGQLIASGGEALNGDNYNGATRLFNSGLVIGHVEFGEANDFYDGRGGTVQGNVIGRNGNDTFIPGASTETIDGDGGSAAGLADLLDFSASTSITVALDGSLANTGNALGDTYSNIENVRGSSTGNDTLIGNGVNNTLSGLGGVDSLNGKAGADVLVGGGAKDTLKGDVGNDRFRFDALSECGDSIVDFSSNAVGNNDHIAIKASAFGGGLVAGAAVVGGAQPGAQFIIRADNVAQDANDRFIFRTTDKTLWFDSNGNAAGGLTLVADLQAAATFTAADIVLI